MKNKKTKIVLLSLLLVAFAVILYAVVSHFLAAKAQSVHPVPGFEPFEIEVVGKPEIVRGPRETYDGDTLVQLEGEEDRLEITVSITNTTEQDFKNTWIELTLNPELEPFVASGIINFIGDKLYVTTLEKAAEIPKEDGLKVCGFEHGWNMLLNTPENLEAYYGKRPEDIFDALKFVDVWVRWDGGSQHEIVPLRFK